MGTPSYWKRMIATNKSLFGTSNDGCSALLTSSMSSHQLEWNEEEPGSKLFGYFVLSLLTPPIIVYQRRGRDWQLILNLILFFGLILLLSILAEFKVFENFYVTALAPLLCIIHALYLTFTPLRKDPPPAPPLPPQHQQMPSQPYY